MNNKNYLVIAVGLSALLCPSQSICNSTAVQLYDGVAALANPGTYFLSQDVLANAISISGDNITLNLNGHQIGGLTIDSSSNISNIFVSNGVINNTVTLGATSNVSNVHLSDLVIQNALTHGISILQASEVFVSHVLVKDCTMTGLRIVNSKRIFISDSEFLRNDNGILVGDSVSEVVVRDCQANKNSLHGAFIGIANQVYFIRFIASDNTTDGINGSVNVNFAPISFACFDCIFAQNGLGINPARTTFVLKGCLAENNTTGFAQVFTQAGIITQCVSNNNVNGFKDADAFSACRYTSNYAYNNGTANYTAPGPSFNPVGPLDLAAQFWRNVDGT